jgi:1,4-alpha-glucan branching enzyme
MEWICRALVVSWLTACLQGQALRAAAHDSRLEADGIWHDKVSDIMPRHPARGEGFRLELRAFRYDATRASLALVVDGRTTHLPMRWDRHAEGDTYDVWAVDVPGIESDSAHYHFQIFDGSAFATFARSGFWNGSPPGGDFQLNLTGLGAYELGATVTADATVFRVWCPGVERAQVVLDPGGGEPLVREMAVVDGHWQVRVEGVGAGRSYRYRFLRNGQWFERNDPRARRLARDLRHSITVDSHYAWKDEGWVPPDLEESIICEAHVGTFSGRGDGGGGHPAGYRDLVDRHVAHLAEAGFNVLQLMPVQEFPGDISWGYNPAFLFAPESAYGTPEDLKYLVEACHRAGIAVWLDVVLNHFDGPNLEGNLGLFNGEELYFYPEGNGYRDTGYGPRPDYGRVEVREMLVDAMRFWIEEYHIDGFRLDHTNLVKVNGEGWQLLREIAQMRDRVDPRVVLTAEQWPNDESVTRPVKWGGAGMDAQWSDLFHDNARAALNQLAYGDPSMWQVALGLNHFGYSARQMIHFIESHDESRESPQFAAEGRLVQVADQIGPHSSYGLGRGKLFYGLTMFGAATPLFLHGQEIATEIGFGDKEVHKIPWERKAQFPGFFAACRDMAWLKRRSPALRADRWQRIYHVNEAANVLAWERAHNGHFVIVVANFSNTDFADYWVGLPTGGTWHETINTNAVRYGGSGSFQNGPAFIAFDGPSGGMPFSAPLKLPRHSMVVLTNVSYDLEPRTDADRDGIDDQWESARQRNPNLDFDAGLDPDRDGFSNRDEFLWGTNPDLPNGPPGVLVENAFEGRRIRHWLPPRRAARLEISDDLKVWTPEGRGEEIRTGGSAGPVEIDVLDPEPVDRRFYRFKIRWDP